MCARRLRLEHSGQRGNRRADARFRVANQFLDDVRLAHVDERPPELRLLRPAPDLEPEQRRVYDAAARWYARLFGSQPVRSVEVGFETTVASLGVRLVGPAGLPVEHRDGTPELRLLRLGSNRVPRDVRTSPEVRFSILRLAAWCSGRRLRVVVADLVSGKTATGNVTVDEELPELHVWLAARVETVRSRVATPSARAGIECGWCPFIAGCDAHGRR